MPKTGLQPEVFPFFDYRRYAFSLGVRAGERAWLSGHTASRHDPKAGRTVVTGDLAEQAAVSMAKQGLILEAGGLGHPDVVKVTDYVTPAGLAQYAALRGERKRLYGDHPPATSTVVVNSLLRPEALIETEAIAARGAVERFGIGWGVGGVPAAAAVRVGDLLYCSTAFPVDPDGGVVVRGGIVEQTAQVYRNAGTVLRQAGFAMADVVRTVEFIHRSALPEYKDTWRVRAEHLGPPGQVAATATGIPMAQLALSGALIQVEFTAFRGGGTAVNPGWRRYERLTYAPGVRAGDYLFVSGLVATDAESGEILYPGDVAGQTRFIYEHVRHILTAAGLGKDAVVKTTEYVTPDGLPGYRQTAAVRRAFFDEPYPAATGVVCEALLRPGALIEVDCVAVA